MASIFRSLLRLITLLFFAGNTLLLILIIISGATNNFPVDRFYWVQADTQGIANASDITRWTFWGACQKSGDVNLCGTDLSPAYPISPVDNFGTTTDVPEPFISNRDSFYYLTRFSFCFFWISLAFIGISFLIYVGTWCSYGFAKVVWMLTAVGCLFNVTAVVLQTAASVMARNAFSDADREASIGADLFGIAWASVFLSLCEMVSTIVQFVQKSVRNHQQQKNEPPIVPQENRPFKSFFLGKTEPYSVEEPVIGGNDPYAPNTVNPITTTNANENNQKGINFFTVRKSQKSKTDEESV